MRAKLRALLRAALKAADPETAVHRALRIEKSCLIIIKDPT